MKKNRLLRVLPNPILKKLIMELKIAFFLLMACVSSLLAIPSYSQVAKVSLNMKNASLESVLDEIESQSEFYFIFNQKQIDVNRVVDIKEENKLISDILPDLFKGTGVNFAIIDRKILLTTDLLTNDKLVISSADNPQQYKISGVVSDKDGFPLPGVNVIVTGTTQGVITDIEGKYSIVIPPGSKSLTFTFVGMESQVINIGTTNQINVLMGEAAIGLDEVVVIGYGTMRKSDLTGSIVTADLGSFRETANVNIVQSLQGSVAGLNVGAITKQGQEPAISIRGLNTLGGSTSPLIVLDNTIYRGRIVDINPSDIESVVILKDASASAVYGSQAANGVIILTTKRGQITDKPNFSYSGSIGFQSPTKLWTPMNREQFFQKNRDVWWRQAYLPPDYTQPNPAFNDLSAILTIHQVEGYGDGTDTDWLKSTIGTGILNNHNLSMQSGNSRTSYFTSLGYTNSKGYVKNDNFERYSLRMNVDNKILDWFTFGIQSFATVSNYKGIDADLGSVLGMSPLAKSHNPDGSLFLYPDGFLTPLYYQNTQELNRYLTLGGDLYATVDIPFVNGLKYRVDIAPDYRTQRYYTYNPYDLSEKGSAEKRYSNNFDYSIDQRLNYSKKFGRHFFDATLAAGVEKRVYDYTSAYSGEFALQGLGYNRLQDGSVGKQKTTTNAWEESSVFQMARLLYNFDERYLITGTVRRDGFSGFGHNNKFGIFPSIALGWRITEEEFLKDRLSWLNQAKLRMSYGENGNRTLERYQTLAKMTSGYTYTFGGASAMSQTTSTMKNDDLRWETTTSLNLGIDFAILNSRINGSAEYYFSTTSDMLYQVSLPVIGGIETSFTNLGEIKNQGLEITLNTVNINSHDFNWESTISFSRNRNRIVSLLGRDNNGDGKEDDLVSQGLFIGKGLSAIYTYNVLGVYQLKDTDIPKNSGPGLYRYEDLNGDGIISAANDRKIIGNSDPSYRWSLNNTFTYKNFTLMIFLNSIQGGKDYYYAAIQGPTGGAIDDNVRKANYGVEHSKYWWTPLNPGSLFKETFNYDPVQNNRYFQRSFVRIQDVSLSYRFNSPFLKKIKVKDLSAFVSGKNLYTWTDWLGLDPELGLGFTASAPLLKNITFGFNMTF
jgi:TonB-dependent starch-binding outer membrane protein SusC